MHIPAYQIHNVLKAYSRQVSQNKLGQKNKARSLHNINVDKVSISAEGKKQGIVDKVASDIVQKITSRGPEDTFEHEIVGRIEEEIGKKIDFSKTGENEFRYYEVTENSSKLKKFSFQDAELVRKRMEDLTKDFLTGKLENKGEEK